MNMETVTNALKRVIVGKRNDGGILAVTSCFFGLSVQTAFAEYRIRGDVSHAKQFQGDREDVLSPSAGANLSCCDLQPE